MTDPDFHELFFKTADPHGTGKGYRPTVGKMWRQSVQSTRVAPENGGTACTDDGLVNTDTVLFQQTLPADVVHLYGGASELWQEWTFRHPAGASGNSTDGDATTAAVPVTVNITVWAFNKTRTRITESWWLRFHPIENDRLSHRSMRLARCLFVAGISCLVCGVELSDPISNCSSIEMKSTCLQSCTTHLNNNKCNELQSKKKRKEKRDAINTQTRTRACQRMYPRERRY
jgi:hypothetical protein